MYKTPRHLPQLLTMLDDIPANDRQIAKHLGLSVQTIARYRRKEQAPRPVMLALFWITSWGERTIYADLFNQAMYARNEAGALRKEVAAIRQQIRLLEIERQHYADAANAPSFGGIRPIQQTPSFTHSPKAWNFGGWSFASRKTNSRQ